MKRGRISIATGVAMGLVLLVAASPVGAGSDPDYLTWRWGAPGARGLGLIKTGPGTLQVELANAGFSQTVGIVLSSVRCTKASNASNTLVAYGLLTSVNGGAYLNVTLSSVSVTSIKSVRLFKGNTQLDCSRVARWSKGVALDGKPDVALFWFHSAARSFAGLLDVENAEAHWVGHGFASSDIITFNVASAACGHPLGNTPFVDLVPTDPFGNL
jgi:hypothetical protein